MWEHPWAPCTFHNSVIVVCCSSLPLWRLSVYRPGLGSHLPAAVADGPGYYYYPPATTFVHCQYLTASFNACNALLYT